MVKSSPTGGVMPMDLAGRLARERERLLGMTDAERAFRKQYLKDQELAHGEPKFVPELYRETVNPIRRLYRAPLDAFRVMITPIVGAQRALHIRYFAGKFLMITLFAYGCTYYFKYNGNDWTRPGGWRKVESRIAVFPGDPEFPKVSERTVGADYASRGFKDVKVNL
ncbi:uncharacterized protein [Onthophagus taurus]|uniref:uncharacterized protein n=1 Tax=Onthophagus taurus TaxID=166361 RepID=UPI000C209022|nr:uncharacterized protein LOC111421096 [Onthophagus taurus]XP_022909998.1 uncharacterized protein LOC111421097 [Onthophagus taurus]